MRRGDKERADAEKANARQLKRVVKALDKAIACLDYAPGPVRDHAETAEILRTVAEHDFVSVGQQSRLIEAATKVELARRLLAEAQDVAMKA